MHLDTAYAAVSFGYALAEHRRLIGVEIPMPSSIIEEDKLLQDEAASRHRLFVLLGSNRHVATMRSWGRICAVVHQAGHVLARR